VPPNEDPSRRARWGRSTSRSSLIDENLSPTLVQKLGTLGIAAQHVSHLGKSGLSDPALWHYAYEHHQVIVTINAADFLRLAAASPLHAGLIVLRAQGLTREQQWERLRPAVERPWDRAMTWSTRPSRSPDQASSSLAGSGNTEPRADVR
jgi:predicted nuclease of predicted toxin-antitoxin system